MSRRMWKIIFLDVDGVLNDHQTKDRIGGFTGMDTEKVLRLKRIVEATGAKIVLSSTWRLLHGLADMRGFLGERGFERAPIFSKTDANGPNRGWEILRWLDQNRNNVDSFVILDDDSDVAGPDVAARTKEFWVHTTEYDGLTEEGVEKAIKILGPASEKAA